MTKNNQVGFPKINLISIVAGALAIASVFLPWWGITASGFGISSSRMWTLWNAPSMPNGFVGSNQSYDALATYSPIVGATVIIAALLAFVGSFARNIRVLLGGFILGVITPIAYLGIVSYAVTNACNGQPNCLSGPFGQETIIGFTLTWGFQTGFYIFLIAGTLTLIAIGFHRIFHKTTTSTQT